MTVTVTSALTGPATARYSNVYGALVDLGVLSGRGAQDVTGSGDPVAPILNASEFYAPLTHSLVLTRGTGSATYTRATKAWEFGYAAAANAGADQVLIEVATNTPRFGGARYDSGTWYNTYADGSAISASSLLGYHAEGTRTNSLLWARDLTKHPYSSQGIGSELVTNGAFADTSDWTLGAGWTISGGTLNRAVSAGTSAEISVPITAGKTYTVTMTVSITTAGYATIDLGSYAGSVNLVAGTRTFNLVAGSSNSLMVIFAGAAFSGTIDNISVKEAAVQVTTCTGIDNAANSASTLTASAADATILQTLTLAAAARSFSAYVKRRTGTGNVYITRDGGTSWTDITSQINSTTWTRVKIENTSVLNPSCGFKIATSGDAIDVDVCQDEAGAFITSPIVTTTAAVTRNGDRLLYAKSGNFADAAGTASTSWCIDSSETTYGASSRNALCVDAGGRLIYGTSSASVRNGGMYDGTSTLHSIDGTARNNKTHVKTSSKWSGTSMSVINGGAALNTGTYDKTMGTGTYLDIGGDLAGNNIYGHIKNTYIWQTALTDAQLAQVTA